MAARVRWWVRLTILLVVLGMLAFAAGLAISAFSVRRAITEASAGMSRGRADLMEGKAAAAGAAFEDARGQFSHAVDVAGNGWFDVFGWMPILGRNADAVRAIAEAGVDLADAGSTLSGAMDSVPGGMDSLAPNAGRVQIDRFQGIHQAASTAADQTAHALARIEEAPTELLVGPVAAARLRAENETRSIHETLSIAADLIGGLPGFLGSDGARRYFVGAQNPAELRGTGGLIGAYSILTIDDGRFEFSRFEPIQSLPIPELEDVPPPSAEYAENYDEFRTEDRFWLAINLTPDFPTAAEAILNAYQVANRDRLDGVIVADPFALEALLRLTGPTRVPRLATTMRAEEVVNFMANGAYAMFREPAVRKHVLGAVAEAVFTEFLARDRNSVEGLRVLAQTAADGHVLAYSEDPEMQGALSRTGAGGALRAHSGDVLSVIENSAGGTKVDFFQEREIRYEVELWTDGSARALTDIDFKNGAPTSGQPAYVIGPNPGSASLGEDVQLVTLYCLACRLEEAELDGERVAVGTGIERGFTYYRDYFRTPSGAERRLEMTWHVPDAWHGDETSGVYRFTFLGQTTIRPTSLAVRITAPEGTHIISTSPGMRVDGDVATYEGSPHRLELEVEFQAPLWARIWHALTP